MDKVKVIYGSTTGNTESAARQIASAFRVEAVNIVDATKLDFGAELLILGSSTWGLGELQDDWSTGLSILESSDLKGKKVAVFGTGDQHGFSDTYCDAIGIIAEKAESCGATLIGKTSTMGYCHTGSKADEGGTFLGLALDDDNEQNKTAERIAEWTKQLASQIES